MPRRKRRSNRKKPASDGNQFPIDFKYAKEKAGSLKQEIDRKIDVIWDEVAKASPENLLMMATDLEKMGDRFEDGDVLIYQPSEHPSRPTEYIQSIIVSQDSLVIDGYQFQEDVSEQGFRILADIEELHSLIQRYLFLWAITLRDEIDDRELVSFVREAQSMYFGRGNRYQCFQEEYLKSLITPHNDELQKLFQVSSNEVVDGLMELEYALSQGRIQGMNVIGEIINRYSGEALPRPEELPSEERLALESAFVESFSVQHYDVIRATGWPKAFVKELSYAPGEATWKERGAYTRWPIVALPVQDRPFISLGKTFYCFDYYSLFDNAYRSIQKTILRCDPDYQQCWQERQKEASEHLAERLLERLLPGCNSYHSNHYSPSGKKGQLCENDLLVQFNDILIVVEVKAGAFTYAPPITHYSDHIRYYRELIEKADHQCNRVLQYLNETEGVVSFRDARGCDKFSIDMSKITDVFAMSVTVEDINAFASKAERLSFLTLECGAISISVNDLMVYADYFDNPYQFLHFLRQRRTASKDTRLAFNDELDHLGMYIDNNQYVMTIDNKMPCGDVFCVNYRDELDAYYGALSLGVNAVKPKQKLPWLFEEIIRVVSMGDCPNSVQLTSYFLDFSDEAREQLSSFAEQAFNAEKVRPTGKILNYCGVRGDSIRLSCLVVVGGISDRNDASDFRDYALSMMLVNEEPDRAFCVLTFDPQGAMLDVVFETLRPDCVDDDMRDKLKTQGQSRANGFVAKHIQLHGKIGRNEQCPCGSGRKYKKCHGR